VSPFRFRIGKLGIARQAYGEIGGWRHLWWRLWWCVEGAPLPPLVRVIAPLVPPKILHWSVDDSGYPLCGAPKTEAWTRDIGFVTCATCREQGAVLWIQYTTNTR
jgi:hypothetical protein